MDLSFLTPEEQKHFTDGNYDGIPTEKLVKLRDMTLENKSRDMPDMSVFDEVNETGTSPLSMSQRVATQFGDKQGNIDYLKNQGLNPIYRDGKLYVVGKDRKLTPADPGPSTDIMSMLKDAPNDIAEFAADVPSMVTQGLGETLGAAGGGALGGPLGGWLGRTAGGAAGSYGGEKIRQLIGEQIGNYSGDNSADELDAAGLGGAISSQITPLMQMLKGGTKALGVKGLESKIPQRMYASGTGLLQQMQDDPTLVDELMNIGIKGSPKSVLSQANTGAQLAEDELQSALQGGDDIAYSQIVDRLKGFQKKAAPGDIMQQNRATSQVLNELKNDSGIFNKVYKNIPADAPKPLDIPPDEYLQQLYNKQFPRDKINLPMAPYTETVTKSTNRPTLEEFKKQVLDQFATADAPPGQIEKLLTNIDDIYASEYPATKQVKRTYPLPKGKMEAPSFEDWKQQYVGKLAKQNRGQEFKTVADDVASQVDLNRAKRGLYKSSQKLFNTETAQVNKKQAQKEISLTIKDLLASNNDKNLNSINRKLHVLSTLADMMDLKISDDLADPVLSGTTRVLGSLGGAKSGIMNSLTKAATQSTGANTRGSLILKNLLEKMSSVSTKPTVKNLLSDILAGDFLRNLDK